MIGIDGAHAAKADYAVRTLIELAAVGGQGPAKAEALATAQGIPHKFLGGAVGSASRGPRLQQAGADGGYWCAREASDISVADVIRAVEGPLASVRGQRPEDAEYAGPARPLTRVWLAVRVNLRAVLEAVSLADIVDDDLPGFVKSWSASRRHGRVDDLSHTEGNVWRGRQVCTSLQACRTVQVPYVVNRDFPDGPS